MARDVDELPTEAETDPLAYASQYLTPRSNAGHFSWRYRRLTAISSILDNADQDQVKLDLSNYFGPRGETYLYVYEKMRTATGRRRLNPINWCWPAFLLGAVWFFYRKMYLYGFSFILLLIILGFLDSTVAKMTSFIFAMSSKGAYVKRGLRTIVKADGLGLVGTERAHYLSRAGGISLGAGVSAAMVFVLCIAARIFLVRTGR
jgi:Protein of unknown function (DUF2628)